MVNFNIQKGDLTSNKLTASSTVTKAAVDSGACDSITPSNTFKHTEIKRTRESGKIYGACGGEPVVNMGSKTVTYATRNGKIRKAEFQVGDNITRPLLAVSQECAKGNWVIFGPGPKYESYICHDPETFVCHNNDVTKIDINNGIYEISMKELYAIPEISGVDEEAETQGGPEVHIEPEPTPPAVSAKDAPARAPNMTVS